jgi:hypothetical protein
MNYIVYMKMDGTGDHHVKLSKQSSERRRLHIFPLL